ncbi:MAG: CDP-diacylglycerol--serine O-phosphatidyltransferase [Pirellulaceae bacterium]|nr:CDP-diacylglycerol--serine O-phosphatidyltransferase [Pirellulaceae bacterium]
MSELKRELFPPSSDPAGADDPDGDIVNGDVDSKKRSKKRSRGKRRKKKKRRLTLAVLPTLLTLGNAVCGLAAIAIIISDSQALDWAPEQKLFVAGLLIFGGMLFDALDGSAARMTGQASQFGAELDSLCDAVTFGTAPAVILWQMSDAFPQRLIWGIGVLFTLCVLIRLARFNVETSEDDTHDGFEGLPSPAAAGTLAAFAIAIPELISVATDELYPEQIRIIAQRSLDLSHYFLPALALALAYLMVSRFQYPHVFQQWVRGRRAMHQIGQALFVLFGVFLLHWLALPLFFTYFAFASPVRSLVDRKMPAQMGSERDEAAAEDAVADEDDQTDVAS